MMASEVLRTPIGPARLMLLSHLGEMDVPPLPSEAPRHQATADDAVDNSKGSAMVENTGSRPHVQGGPRRRVSSTPRTVCPLMARMWLGPRDPASPPKDEIAACC